MNRVFFSRLVYVVALVGAGFVLGCGGKEGRPLAPVSGKVTVDGKPLSSGQVTFIPDVPSGQEGTKQASKLKTTAPSVGEIGPDGTYKISTGGKDGAPLGKYKVTVSPSMVPAPDATDAPATGFNRKFSDAHDTPLKVEVVATPAPGAYDLKLTK
jgi:hypothetical protein